MGAPNRDNRGLQKKVPTTLTRQLAVTFNAALSSAFLFSLPMPCVASPGRQYRNNLMQYKKAPPPQPKSTSLTRSTPTAYLAVRHVLAWCCIIAILSGCHTHYITGYEKYGEPIKVLHYISKGVLYSGEFTNAVGLPPADTTTLQEDDEGLKRTAKGAAAGSPQYLRANSQEHLTIDVFNGSLGPWFQIRNLPMTSNLLQRAFDDTWVTAHRAKDLHFRQRPEPTIKNSSYPSVHATEGMVLATVLLWLDPKCAAQAEALGEEIGTNRLILQKHYPSDVKAGQRLGCWLVQRMRQSQRFCKDFAAAQRELKPYVDQPD